MFRVIITTKSGRPFGQLLPHLRNAVINGSNLGNQKVASLLTRQLKSEVPVWKGNLRNSIKTRTINKNELAIYMNFYGSFVETGHTINSIPPRLLSWISEKFGPQRAPFVALALLKKGYTDANPFITRALIRTRARIAQEFAGGIRAQLRKEGFK